MTSWDAKITFSLIIYLLKLRTLWGNQKLLHVWRCNPVNHCSAFTFSQRHKHNSWSPVVLRIRDFNFTKRAFKSSGCYHERAMELLHKTSIKMLPHSDRPVFRLVCALRCTTAFKSHRVALLQVFRLICNHIMSLLKGQFTWKLMFHLFASHRLLDGGSGDTSQSNCSGVSQRDSAQSNGYSSHRSQWEKNNRRTTHCVPHCPCDVMSSVWKTWQPKMTTLTPYFQPKYPL